MAMRMTHAVHRDVKDDPGVSADEYAWIDHAFGVHHPASCSQGGRKKRGTMLPPAADRMSTTKVDRTCAC
jgi:hypothetical protein